MRKTVKVFSLLVASLACSQMALAKNNSGYKGEVMPVAPAFTPAWYAGANIGESRTHDNPAPGSGDSVTQIGPGWSVDLGYQFVQWWKIIWAGELGYTQYYHSSETQPNVNVATTDHFAAYAALVAELPLVHNFGILGKAGAAYSYAKKVFTASGGSDSANVVAPYYGAGLTYHITPKVSLIAQWARARGNGSTGSTDLTSLGVSCLFG